MKPKYIYKIKVNRSLLFFIFFVLVSCSVMGQGKLKKQLTSDDYDLWGILENSMLSYKGNWVSYSMRYQSHLDTLFLRRTNGKKSFAYPLSMKGKFSGEQWFACIDTKGMLYLTNLENETNEVISDVTAYEFSSNGKYLVLLYKAKDEKKRLTIRNLLNGNIETVENITGFRLNDDLNQLAYCAETSNGSEGIVATLDDTIGRIAQLPFLGDIGTHIIWQKNSSSVVFVLQPVNSEGKLNVYETQLAQYRFASKQLYVLDPKKNESFPMNKHIVSQRADDLCISDDGSILFQVVPDSVNKNEAAPLVEIWHGDDLLLYSEQQQYGPADEMAKTVVWYPETTTVFDFMKDDTRIRLSGNRAFALTSIIAPCAPQFKYTPNGDYHITNLKTKEQKLLLQCHSGETIRTNMAPLGKYIAYFKDCHWYTYNTANGIHKNITAPIGKAFYDEFNDIGDKPDPYGLYGWTANDKSILVYDQFDIWEIFADGSQAKRLTHGREKNICFRPSVKTQSFQGSGNFLGITDSETIDLNSPLLLSATNMQTNFQGFCIFEKGKEKLLHFSSNRITEVEKSTDAEKYLYIQEDYGNPPSVQLLNEKNGKSTLVFQSNPQHYNYQWGKVSTISYSNSKGEMLKGLLYYPSDYKKGTLYPMIVHVYEKQSQNINEYINPSQYLYTGFNVVDMVTNGYFVLLSDINYTVGVPGDSATDCVTAAVESVLSLGIIASKKIGLMGHSFGGYETSYIITKSNLFATAIAGAAQTDYLSGYLTVSENYKKAEFWRYEEYTNRMTQPLFEDLEGYIYNSPVYHAQSIETPLLLWTGEKDKHVAATQSMELYLAMRRLGKKVTMLRYPNEDHSLINPKKQADLNIKVREWFDYYLKDKPLKKWM